MQWALIARMGDKKTKLWVTKRLRQSPFADEKRLDGYDTTPFICQNDNSKSFDYFQKKRWVSLEQLRQSVSCCKIKVIGYVLGNGKVPISKFQQSICKLAL